MTDSEINIAIAKACGWTFAWPTTGPSAANKSEHVNRCSWSRPNGWKLERLPNYCHDLNAMHEAEAMITVGEIGRWLSNISNLVMPQSRYHPMDLQWWSVRATARQRAEAFLRVKGLWKEGA